MLTYFTASTYTTQIKTLEKKPKNGYVSCMKDIHNFLKNKTIENLWNYRNTEQDISPTIRLKKVRISDTFQKKGSSSGYRFIYIIDQKKKTLTFLYVYPKQGKLGQDNYKGNRKEILLQYLSELTENKLLEIWLS